MYFSAFSAPALKITYPKPSLAPSIACGLSAGELATVADEGLGWGFLISYFSSLGVILFHRHAEVKSAFRIAFSADCSLASTATAQHRRRGGYTRAIRCKCANSAPHSLTPADIKCQFSGIR